jgi:hypothetical protein
MVAAKLDAIDHGPFLGFALRRILRSLVAALLIVLLAGAVISTNTGYQETLREQEVQACLRAHVDVLKYGHYSPILRFCSGGI